MFNLTTGGVRRVSPKPATSRSNAPGISKGPQPPQPASVKGPRPGQTSVSNTRTRAQMLRQQERRAEEMQRFEDELPSYTVEAVNISLYDPEEVLSQSVCEVNRQTTEPVRGSVNDPRMGVVDDGATCGVCRKDNTTCPGHFGHIELNEPILHPSYIGYIASILSAVCQHCGGLLVKKSEIERLGLDKYTGENRLKQVVSLAENRNCFRDNSSQDRPPCLQNVTIKTTKETGAKSNSILYELDGGETGEFTAREIEKIFRNISQEDAELMGFSNGAHPKKFILRRLPVMPPCVRPSAYTDGEERNDHLTTTYVEIVKINNAIQEARKDGNATQESRLISSLYDKIAYLVGNQEDKTAKKSEQKTIKERLKGKEGNLRGNLMGKRVNNTGRSVISPDPSLKFGQIRIPEFMAEHLTVKEIVNQFNYSKLRDLLEKNKINYLISGSGKTKGNRYRIMEKNKDKFTLRYGDILYRHLQNGDYVIANRQPTLHKQSFMGFEVVLGGPSTIGLHMSATEPFNADFDGDEMNIHVPQTLEAVVEVQELLNVKKCIADGQANRPMIGLVYDNISAVYLLTRSDQESIIEVDDFYNYLTWMTTFDYLTLKDRMERQGLPTYTFDSSIGDFRVRVSDDEPIDAYPGKALFSALLPQDFYYKKGDVVIREGILVSGTIKKAHVGAKDGSIIQAMLQDYGSNRTSDFITDASWVLNRYLTNRELSVGLEDCVPENYDAIQEEVGKRVYEAKSRVIGLGGQKRDQYQERRREELAKSYVNVARDAAAKNIIDSLQEDNSMYVMANSGAKGKQFNLAQITGLLGQQYVSGSRIKPTLTEGTRCLPYFEPGDLDPEARGFCPSSFYRGLSPAEMVFHAMGGREGLIDTAVKTSDTGYFQRKLTKALENILIAYDLSARNYYNRDEDKNGEILQMLYGGDGMDARYLETVKTPRGEMPAIVNLERLIGKLNIEQGFTNAPVKDKYRPLDEEVEFE